MDDILIVGAGPVGLFLAIELVRHGLRPRIVERRTTPARFSRAIAVQPRTLELLEASGVTAALLERGQKVRILGFQTGSHRFSWSLDDLPSAHPYVLVLPQNDTEAVLEARARALGVVVQRGVELVHLEQGERVQVILHHGDGRGEELRSVRWVAACDGAQSTVRRWTGATFSSVEPGVRFLVADVRCAWPVGRDETWLHSTGDGLCALFPMPGGDDRWRVMADIPEGDPVDPSVEQVQAIVAARAGLTAPVAPDGWITGFSVHERVASRFRDGQVFLLGDAAHTHSPVGGQGMNTGLQDAQNLAWKMAEVIRYGAPDALLDTYDLERRPVAQAVVDDTGRATRLGTAKGLLPQWFRDHVLGFLGGFGIVAAPVVRRATELGVGYGRSPLSVTVGRAPTSGALAAGDHVPDAQIYRTLRVGQLLRGPAHVLFLFAGDGNSTPTAHLRTMAADATDLLGGRIEVHLVVATGALPPVLTGAPVLLDPLDLLHQLFGAAAGSAFLVRPDGYIAWRCHPVDLSRLRSELTRRFGLEGGTAGAPA